MRRALVLLLMMACGNGKSTPSQGSALPAPQQELMNTVAKGVFDAPPVPADAAAPPDAAAEPDAAVATGPTLSNKGGLSTIGKFQWNKQDEQETAKLLQKKLGLADIKVSFDVMDVPGEVEREEGYWSVKRGDKEIVQVLRAMDGPDDGPAAVLIWTPEVTTSDGIKVGSTVADVLAKHPDLTCRGERFVDTVEIDLICLSPKEKHLRYILDAKKAKKERNPAKLSDVGIVGFAHDFGP